jgi:hypothetical protein
MTTHTPAADGFQMGPSPLVSWWASVARLLDEVDERLATDLADQAVKGGALRQALQREPRLHSRLRGVAKQRDHLRERVSRLRASVSRRAGERGAADDLVAELDILLTDEKRHARSVRLVVWDAYTQDIGAGD